MIEVRLTTWLGLTIDAPGGGEVALGPAPPALAAEFLPVFVGPKGDPGPDPSAALDLIWEAVGDADVPDPVLIFDNTLI